MFCRHKKAALPRAFLLAAAFLAVFSLFGCDVQPAQGNAASAPSASFAQKNETQVYFLDVGQGDCELIRLKSGQTVLIDAGTGETSARLTDYIKNLGVTRVDLLIATHPHEDHIGGMAQVVRSFPVGKVYMPKIADSQVPTTSVYEKLLTAIQDKGLTVSQASGGDEIYSAGDETMRVFAPNSSKYSGLNSYSVVVKLTCGQKSFLFTGDAEADSEKEMLKKGYDLKSDVLKCGHHGSSTSTSAAFLKAVGPGAAVISCGVDNDYGHPDAAVVARLEKAGVAIYRTDRQGTILARCDGTRIEFSTGLPSVVEK